MADLQPAAKNPFEDAPFGACVIDLHGGVVYRNHSCEDICACRGEAPCDESRGACPFAAMASKTALEEHVHLVRGLEANGRFFDVANFKDASRVYRFVFPLDAKIGGVSEVIKHHGLTKRELEIAALMVAGIGNEKISARLHISHNTLRTHLKSIYRKLPREALDLIGDRSAG